MCVLCTKLNQFAITLPWNTVSRLLRCGRGSVLGACSAFLASQPSLCVALRHRTPLKRDGYSLGYGLKHYDRDDTVRNTVIDSDCVVRRRLLPG